MSKKSTCFNRAQVYDRSLAPMLITFVCLLAVLPEGLKIFAIIYLLGGYFLVHIWCVVHDLIPFLRKQGDSIERVYEGKFNDLLKEMYEVGLELKSKMGSRYIFSTKYLIFENERYLVEEYEGICTVRSSRRCISLLEKHVDLKGENA